MNRKNPVTLLGIRLVSVLALAVTLAGCTTTGSDSDQPKRQVEHPNPMGGVSTYTYE